MRNLSGVMQSSQQVRKGSIVFSNTWRGYTGIAAKGGIRQSRLHLYLGEYVWRYNHRHLNLKEQENYLMKLLQKYIRSG